MSDQPAYRITDALAALDAATLNLEEVRRILSTPVPPPPPPIDIDGDYWNDDDDPENDPAYNKNYILPMWSKCGKWKKRDFGYACSIVQRIPDVFVYAN